MHHVLAVEGLMINRPSSLPAGTIDEIQRLHIRRVPLHEQPRRIAHQAQTRTLAVLTEIQGHTVGADEPDRCFIRLLDDQASGGFLNSHCRTFLSW
jgi:DNA damage-binding protein 1